MLGAVGEKKRRAKCICTFLFSFRLLHGLVFASLDPRSRPRSSNQTVEIHLPALHVAVHAARSMSYSLFGLWLGLRSRFLPLLHSRHRLCQSSCSLDPFSSSRASVLRDRSLAIFREVAVLEPGFGGARF